MLLLATAVLPASAAKKPLINVPLVWKPAKSLAKVGVVDLTGIGGTGIHVLPFTDARKDAGRIGESREEEDEGKILPVTTRDDVPRFLQEHFESVLGELGLKTGPSMGAFVLSGEVIQFFVTERNTYVGDVRLRLRLRKPDGAEVWNGLVAGSEEHWGRSYKAENYHETLCDSIVLAAFNLLREEGFRKALSVPPTATPSPPDR
jgi:hypothetical protein